MNDKLMIELFGEENLNRFSEQISVLETKQQELEELSELRKRASEAFKVDLSLIDITVSASAGVLLGLGNSLFKNFFHIESIKTMPNTSKNKIMWKNTFGSFKHKHKVTRTIIDAKPPRMPGMKFGEDLHRQIGPMHDIARFKETLSLLMGKTNDYSIYGKTATEIIGHKLSPIGMKFSQFLATGGFNIPANPAAELNNHLLIDFFTKRSIPIPGSTYIADKSPELAKLMLYMYDKGLNYKNFLGNMFGFLLLLLIIHGYNFLFKAIPESNFSFNNLNQENVKKLWSTYLSLIKKNEFHVQMILAHGSSFLVDTLITVGTKSYVGLFQLNYMSLLWFSKNLLQYVIKSTSIYRDLINQAKEKVNTINSINTEWYSNFRNNLLMIASNDNFRELYDPYRMEINHKIIKSRTDQLLDDNQKKKQLSKELDKDV